MAGYGAEFHFFDRYKEDVDEVLQTHLVQGGRVDRLMLQTADKLPSDRASR